jgi:hypothetical protein
MARIDDPYRSPTAMLPPPLPLPSLPLPLLLLLCVPVVWAHPQPAGAAAARRLGGAPSQTCDPARPELAPVLSYHAHVHFLPNNNESVATAAVVHADFKQHFFGSEGGAVASHCTGDFHQPELCIWQSDPCMGPIGPFATGQWAA